MRHRWLHSARWDLTFLFVPAWLTVLLAALVPPLTTGGAWTFLLVVVAIDVAHVYASLYRSYLVPGEVARRPGLYLGAPALALVTATLVYSLDAAWFWTALAYLAAFHFLKQQVGFLSLFRLRAGLPHRSREARLERWALYAVTAWPLLWWHANLPRSFTWFLEGDFLVGMPAWAPVAAALPAAGVLVLHGWTRLRSDQPVGGRDLWLLTTALVYGMGIVLTDSDWGFTLTNIVLHGVPYLALVYLTATRLQAHDGRPPRWAHPALFIAPLWLLAGCEEALWDRWVWHEHPMFFGESLAEWAWLTPLLAVPQITHYVLDRYLWRLDSSDNPGLREALLGSRLEQPHGGEATE